VTGSITTLHGLRDRPESPKEPASTPTPVRRAGPPASWTNRDTALAGIADALRGVPYLHQVVVCVDGAERREDFDAMRAAFEGGPTSTDAAQS
jgi:hypothetical protein